MTIRDETARVKKDTDVSIKVTLEGSPECVNRVLRLLNMISWMGGVGHSGIFGVSWDGDGSDKLHLKGLPKEIEKDTKGFNASCSYGGSVEYLGEGDSVFVMNNNPNATYPKYKLVWKDGQEITE
jgi:hypothetical protein